MFTRTKVLTLAAVLLATLMPLAASASVDPVAAENQFVDLINHERTSRGLAPLANHADLIVAARTQAAAMRDAGSLFHTPDLGSVTTGWTKLGENVGYGGTVAGLHAAFMESSSHRSNVLDPAYTHIGLGVVSQDSTVWVVEIFMQSSAPLATHSWPFRDIDGLSYAQDIADLAYAGITSGCGSELYCPFDYVSRAEMATFLQRALGLELPTADFFSDTSHSIHRSAINAIAQANISAGCGGGRYCPSATVTRGEMATFLARALNLPTATKDYFWDDNDSPHEASINALAQAGITTGCGAGSFCPSGGLTRAEMATFLVRSFGL
jgi:opacity protein-like surface antigen